MNEDKNKVLLYTLILIFGLIGIYFTIFNVGTIRYNSKIKAYKVDENKQYSKGRAVYNPVFYYKVSGKEYKCEASFEQISAPKENEKIVYYNTKNPEKCMILSDKKSSIVLGIECYVIMAVLVFIALKNIFLAKKESSQNRKLNTNKDKIKLYIFFAFFGAIGIYLTFFNSNTNQFDSKTTAFGLEENLQADSYGRSVYYPVYFYRVNGEKYECMTESGNSFAPEENAIIYYDSKNPEKCMVQYDAKSSRIVGIMCLALWGGMIFIVTRKSSSNEESSH